MKRILSPPRARMTVIAVLLVIVATTLNPVVAEDEPKTEHPNHAEEAISVSTPATTTARPRTTTFKPSTQSQSSARQNNNGGFKPSSFEYEQSMRQNSNQMRFPESGEQPKVKREEAVVRLFDGREPNQSPGRLDEDEDNQEDGEQLDQAPPNKTPRGYYDESAHLRDFGSPNPYGHTLPANPQVEDNEVEISPHQYPKRPQQNNFRQDPILNQYRSTPEKYQQYGAPAQTPGNARRPTPTPAYNHRNPYPYSYEAPAPGPYFGYTPIVNDYTNTKAPPPIIASMPYHHPESAVMHSESAPQTGGIHSVRQTHSEIGLEIGPGVGKALKFLLPSALLLTGMSALFPNRIYVPTQPKPLNRQRRGVDYTPVNSDENIEYIPASLLRREHRTDDMDPELYDYDDGTPNPYYGQYTATAKPAKNARPTPTAAAIATSTPTARSQKQKKTQSQKSNLPQFVPIPTSIATANGRDLDPFALPLQDEYDAFQFKSNKKESSKSKSSTTGEDRASRILASTIKSSPVAGSPTQMTPAASSTASSASNTISAPVTSSAKRNSRRRVRPAAGVQVTPTGESVLTLPSGAVSTVQPTTKVTTTTMNSRVRHFPMDNAVLEIMASAATIPTIEEQIREQIQAEKKSFNNNPTPQQELFKNNEKQGKQFDLSPQGPVMGLLSAAVEHRQESDVCQRRALCDLAMRGTNPTATRFETFLWALANLTPNAFTAMYDIDDVFQTIRDKNCARYKCANPNLDIQLPRS